MNKRIPGLEHLKLLALRSTAFATAGISELAGTVAEAVEELAKAKADKASSVSITIPASAWTANPDAATSAAGYAYYADVAVAGLTANDCVETVLDFASLETAKTCGMAGTAASATDSIRYYAEEKPTAALSAQVLLIHGYTKEG